MAILISSSVISLSSTGETPIIAPLSSSPLFSSETPGALAKLTSTAIASSGTHEKAPEAAPRFTAVRHEDERDMTVVWEPVSDTEGYFVRFGAVEDELYTHYQTTGECKVEIRSLVRGVRYHVTVDAYNPGGVTAGKIIKTV